ncbi:suppressor of cytokine signaling 1a [Gadus morhua]|uniref:suppressor of cytokine signaling 1a n=1 Tax=Gadus morhua TaxID=8049 RepID=UPI0011B713B7|nr:suppressor of cytokine signaling 1 [Gadus morhua]
MVAYSTVEGHGSTCTSSSSTSSSSSSSSSRALPRPAGRPHHCPQAEPVRPWGDGAPQNPGPQPGAAKPLSALATHFPPFSSQKDFCIITDTASQLERSGFYWGPLGVEEAHGMLRDAPLGSYLVRDSRQKDVFFTLSYRAEAGAVSVRIVYRRQRFGLAGSERSFAGLFELLQHYVASPKRSLGAPYRKRMATLQELCRRRVAEACGGRSGVLQLPVSGILRDFLQEFPYSL